MKPFFADTFYFLALTSPSDAAHAKAVNAGESNVRIVTTEWVLIEVADGLAGRGCRTVFVRLLESLRSDRRCRIVRFNARDFGSAIDLYDQRSDKLWSLTDCTSFAVMKRLKLTKALTADRHFEQAGFTALLAG